MSDDEGKGTPSLEPPSFFGRKKRAKKQAAEQVQSQVPAAPAVPTPTPPPTRPPTELPTEPPTRSTTPAPQVEETPTTILDADQPTLVQAAAPSGPPPKGSPPPPLFADEPRPSVAATEPPVQPAEPEVPKAPRGPWLTGWAAAIVTGLVVGGLIVGGTAASLRLCTAVRGTESCGNAGFPLLVVILVVAVLLGAVLLRAAMVPEPGSTSFLAVGLLSVVALLFLIDQLLEWWMVIVIPVVSVLTYALAHWVTMTYIEPGIQDTTDEDAPELRDIR